MQKIKEKLGIEDIDEFHMNNEDIEKELEAEQKEGERMRLLWERLEHWLEKHAPEVLSDLNPGATEEEIQELEQAIQYILPEDFKESLRIHNGQAGESLWLIGGWELLSAKRILDEWKVWKGLYNEGTFRDWKVEAADEVEQVWWKPSWIPVTYNGCGDHHCMDVETGSAGRMGQIITMWHDDEERRVLAGNYGEWFAYLVNEIEQNDAEYVFESGEFQFGPK